MKNLANFSFRKSFQKAPIGVVRRCGWGLLVLFLVFSCKKEDAVPKSSEKSVSAFSFGSLNPAVTGSINGTDITATVPFGTNLSLAPSITASAKATVSPASGVVQDFSKTVTYTVTAEDATTQSYNVKVSVGPAPKSSAKDITSFSLTATIFEFKGVINGKNITFDIPATNDITKLVSTIQVSNKATVSPASNLSQNFTNPVNYTVTAEDGSSQVYTVTVTKTYSTFGLVAYYPFNGNAKDGSGKGIDGIPNGAVLAQDRKGGMTCYSFDGAGSSILFTSVPTRVTNNWSISFWVNIPVANQLATFISLGFDNGTKGDGYSIGIGENPGVKGEKIQGIFGGVSHVPFNAGFTINKWYHMVMLRENGQTRLYYNGIYINKSDVTANPIGPTSFIIGSSNGTRPFKGLLDDIRIYERVLSTAEIEALAKE